MELQLEVKPPFEVELKEQFCVSLSSDAKTALMRYIPPNVTGGFPKITRPEIYYGELSNEYVVVRTKSQELDYPAGDQNVYSRYTGRGGVPVSGFLRKLAFAMRFGEIKILLSDDLTPESRVMIYRRVAERVKQAAPFLRFDRDPYLVVTNEGRLVWIVDVMPHEIAPYMDGQMDLAAAAMREAFEKVRA